MLTCDITTMYQQLEKDCGDHRPEENIRRTSEGMSSIV
jgi:hypothetical protein